MPRYTISDNQQQFQQLLELLDRNDDSSQDVWNLVRMLATNKTVYNEVLSFSRSQGADGIDWSSVFEDQSLFKQIYKQEIIVAVMEANKLENINKRVILVSESQMDQKYGSTSGGQAGGNDNLYDTDTDEEEERKTQNTSSGLPQFESQVAGHSQS